jgi:SnoaL-like domain
MPLKIEDKMEISELLSRYNLAMDRNDLDAWLETWNEDGVLIANFGEARGRKQLADLMTSIQPSFASGKRHVSSNMIIGDEDNGNVGVISYLTVIEAKKTKCRCLRGVQRYFKKG